MDDQINLTVGGLLRSLQDIASRHGADTPIVLPSPADADYEQATVPIIADILCGALDRVRGI